MDSDMKTSCLKSRLLAVLLGALTADLALAQTPPPAAPAAAPPTPEHTLTANVGLFSEYIFRGIEQTGGKPAVQGGFDYAHSSGFYLGTWASNISWLEDFGLYNRSSLEWDFYGGYKNAFPGQEDWTYDLGVYGYVYPGKRNSGVLNADTWELYAAIGWKWVSLKGSWTVSSNYFGIQPSGQKTNGTGYYDLSATYPIGDTGFSLLGHVGYLDVSHDGSGDFKASYTDWKLGVSYVVPDGLFKSIELGAYYSGTNAKSAFYTDLTGLDTSRDRGVVYVKKTF
jgi:uncharacterized protein (TIGR02001 family)